MYWKRSENLEKVLRDDVDDNILWFGKFSLKEGKQDYLPRTVILCSVSELASLCVGGKTVNESSIDYMNPLIISPEMVLELKLNGQRVSELEVVIGFNRKLSKETKENNILCYRADLVYDKGGFYRNISELGDGYEYKTLYCPEPFVHREYVNMLDLDFHNLERFIYLVFSSI